MKVYVVTMFNSNDEVEGILGVFTTIEKVKLAAYTLMKDTHLTGYDVVEAEIDEVIY